MKNSFDSGSNLRLLWLACIAALAAPPAQCAMAPALAGGAGGLSGAGVVAAAVQGGPVVTAAAAALSLTPGVLQAVDATRLAVLVAGHRVPLHPTALRVLGPGGQSLGGAAALRAGMVVRFALEPAGAIALSAGPVRTDVPPAANPLAAPGDARRIVLVYVDRAP